VAVIFEIQPINPETYRQQTRRSTLIIAVIFVALAMLLSSSAVMLFGSPNGENFRWNAGGVVAALALTVALVRLLLWSQPWMSAAVYGWQLKRNLMRITNVMHHLKAGVAARDHTAMYLLRFYHLGLTQMHQLDGNPSALSEMRAEIHQHQERMEEMGLSSEQPQLNPAWLEAIKTISVLPQ
jgi:hypothetical protein